MKKEIYIIPETTVVKLQLYGSVLDDHGDFDVVSNEGNGTGYVGGKENDGFFDDVPFGSLWDDDPVEDPFKLDE